MAKRITPLVSLAFSMHSTKGAYALLLGSGVSSGVGVPTGWGITEDLVRRVAKAEGENCEPDPLAWYKRKCGREADYSQLLEMLGQTPAERKQILRPYFEPTPEEVEQGKKIPGKAHRAIAEIVRAGHVKVILTTNFDRLTETAIRDEGVEPTVIHTKDGIKGALPLAHSRCTVFKLHGDYDDTRIMNTEKELATYPPPVRKLLDEVLDRYGLVICGWSADWDVALRAAFERCKSRRFSTFWTHRGELSEKARNLLAQRDAVKIPIESANQFFEQLSENLVSLDEFDRVHPMDLRTTVATTKRYLAEEKHRIRLADLVREECDSVVKQIESVDVTSGEWKPELIKQRLEYYEAAVEKLLHVIAAGCYFGKDTEHLNWVRCLERLMAYDNSQFHWGRLQAYPGFLVFYAGGLTALAGERYGTLAALMTKAKIPDTRNETVPLAQSTFVEALDRAIKNLSKYERHHCPASNYVCQFLAEKLSEYFSNRDSFGRTFDRFEYLLGLVHGDCRERTLGETYGDRFLGFLGEFAYRAKHQSQNVLSIFDEEIEREKEDWPPLKAGLFGGSLERLREVKVGYDKELARLLSNRLI